MRAFLLAIATQAFCQPTRAVSCTSQREIGSSRLPALITADFAPWISSVRRYSSPRLVILPRLVLPPLEFWLGTMPSHAPNCAPLLNCLKSPTPATVADAPISPMPLICAARLASGLLRTC